MNHQNMTYDEQWMVSQLAALKHLPPAFSLPESGSNVATALLTELMAIPETQNPLIWLQSEREAFCALFTVILCLKLGERMRLSRQKLTNTRQQWGAVQTTAVTELEEKQNIFYGHLLKGTEAWSLHEPWGDTFIGTQTQDQVLQTLQSMQHQAQLSPNPHPAFSAQNNSEVYVLSDLLRLPTTVDPLRWLREERREIIASITLARLLDHALPSKRMIIASLPTTLQSSPNVTLHAGKKLKIMMQRAVNRELGFTIDLSVQYHIPKDQRSFLATPQAGIPYRMISWKGFEHIIDTHGHSYVSQVITHRGHSSKNKKYEELFTLVCWPPLVEPTELILQTQPVLFAQYEAPIFSIEGKSIRADTIVSRPSIPIDTQLETRVALREA